jgi:hypothetical protein
MVVHDQDASHTQQEDDLGNDTEGEVTRLIGRQARRTEGFQKSEEMDIVKRALQTS